MSSGGLSRARLDRMHEVLMTQRAGFPRCRPCTSTSGRPCTWRSTTEPRRVDLAGARSSFHRARVDDRLGNPKQRGETTMRFMMIVKANKDSEAGVMPEDKLIAEMTNYNKRLAKAGALPDLPMLHAPS